MLLQNSSFRLFLVQYMGPFAAECRIFNMYAMNIDTFTYKVSRKLKDSFLGKSTVKTKWEKVTDS